MIKNTALFCARSFICRQGKLRLRLTLTCRHAFLASCASQDRSALPKASVSFTRDGEWVQRLHATRDTPRPSDQSHAPLPNSDVFRSSAERKRPLTARILIPSSSGATCLPRGPAFTHGVLALLPETGGDDAQIVPPGHRLRSFRPRIGRRASGWPPTAAAGGDGRPVRKVRSVRRARGVFFWEESDASLRCLSRRLAQLTVRRPKTEGADRVPSTVHDPRRVMRRCVKAIRGLHLSSTLLRPDGVGCAGEAVCRPDGPLASQVRKGLGVVAFFLATVLGSCGTLGTPLPSDDLSSEKTLRATSVCPVYGVLQRTGSLTSVASLRCAGTPTYGLPERPLMRVLRWEPYTHVSSLFPSACMLLSFVYFIFWFGVVFYAMPNSGALVMRRSVVDRKCADEEAFMIRNQF